jgi:hypothetical protein
MPFARVNDQHAALPRARENRLYRLDGARGERDVVPDTVDVATRRAEIGLHVDDE